jgi:hypothetical protein
VVVGPEVNQTNKTTLRSERSGALKKRKKGNRRVEEKTKKDLTGPTLLEISDYPTQSGMFSGKRERRLL